MSEAETPQPEPSVPPGGPTDEQITGGERVEKIELFEAADGWRFRKRAANGEITLTGEAYTRRESAEEAAEREFPDLEVVVIPSEASD
jgi:uncharacterized protein YegP (UPF0339 family)